MNKKTKERGERRITKTEKRVYRKLSNSRQPSVVQHRLRRDKKERKPRTIIKLMSVNALFAYALSPALSWTRQPRMVVEVSIFEAWGTRVFCVGDT